MNAKPLLPKENQLKSANSPIVKQNFKPKLIRKGDYNGVIVRRLTMGKALG